MADPEVLIKFSGGDADRFHGVDMRLLGGSLAGFDRIISDGIILLSENRIPRHRERSPIILVAKEPRIGTASFYGDLVSQSGVLPFAMSVIQSKAGELVWSWVSFVLEYYGGRRSDAEKHLEAMVKMREIEAQERIAMREIEAKERQMSEERWHAHLAAFRDNAFQVAHKLRDASQQAAAPVGPSAANVNFRVGQSPATEIDIPKADAIRAGGELEVGDLQEMTLTVDGFRDHDRKLWVHHPNIAGRYIAADVRDPVFENQESVYAQAAARKATIRVKAKPVFRAGELERIYIMDFGGVIGDAA
jgi:hypothetical protein